MGRLESKCCGDCGRCELLQRNEVDMIPCVLDQIFQRVKGIEKRITALESAGVNNKTIALASSPTDNQNL